MVILNIRDPKNKKYFWCLIYSLEKKIIYAIYSLNKTLIPNTKLKIGKREASEKPATIFKNFNHRSNGIKLEHCQKHC